MANISAPLDWSTKEGIRARFCVIFGIVCAIYLVPWREGAIEIALFIWVPQGIILGAMMAFATRPAAITGPALLMALYPIVFAIWAYLSKAHGMVDVLFIYSIPGAGFGAVIGTALLGKLSPQSELASAGFTSAWTLAGLSINIASIYSNAFGW